MSRRARPHRFLTTAMALALACAAPSAFAQERAKPAGDPAQPQSEPRRPGADPAEFKARLERRLKELQDQQARVEKAIARLDAGDSPAQVLREFEGLFRGLREARQGERAGPDEIDRPRPPRGEEGPPDGMGRERPGREGPGREGPRDAMGELFGGGRPDRPLSQEDRERIMSFMRENMPAMADRIQGLLEADREGGTRVLTRLAPRLREAAEMKRHDEKGFELRRDEIVSGMGVLDAMRDYRDAIHADPSAADTAGAKLREAVAAQFDARLRMQEHDLEMLDQRVKNFHSDLDRKRQDRDRMIDQMVDRIRRGAKDGRGPGGPDEPPPPDEGPSRRHPPR